MSAEAFLAPALLSVELFRVRVEMGAMSDIVAGHGNGRGVLEVRSLEQVGRTRRA